MKQSQGKRYPEAWLRCGTSSKSRRLRITAKSRVMRASRWILLVACIVGGSIHRWRTRLLSGAKARYRLRRKVRAKMGNPGNLLAQNGTTGMRTQIPFGNDRKKRQRQRQSQRQEAGPPPAAKDDKSWVVVKVFRCCKEKAGPPPAAKDDNFVGAVVVGVGYSYLRVATGSSRAARLAGRVPKMTPTMTEVLRAMTAAQ